MAVFGLILVALGSAVLVIVRDGRAALAGLGAQWLGLALITTILGAAPGDFRMNTESMVELLTAAVCVTVLWLTLRGLSRPEIRNHKHVLESSEESKNIAIEIAIEPQEGEVRSKARVTDYMLPAIAVLLGGLAGVGFASIFPIGAPESDLAFYWTAISGVLVLTLDGSRSLTKLALGLLILLNATALLMYMLGLPPLGAVPLGLMAITRVGAALVLAFALSLSMRLFGHVNFGALFTAGANEQEAAPQTETTLQTPYTVGAIVLGAGMLVWALLTGDGIVAALCLFGAALVVAVVAGLPLAMGSDNDPRRLAGGLKHLSMAVVATGLLVAGGLLAARYPINPENTSTLQIGLGLLAVGFIVRAGAVPFAAGSMDLVSSAPLASILMLGAVCPVVMVAGLRVFGGLGSGSLASGAIWTGRDAALWMAAAGALLAGLRALSASPAPEATPTTGRRLIWLATSAIALQVSWALFGMFTGTRSGTLGAALLAVNIALSVPLVVSSFKLQVGTAPETWNVGLFSLLGLPPLGGFVGAMLVAQAAAEMSGAWLGALLLGSVLVAIGWLRTIGRLRSGAPSDPLAWTLVGAQFLWFALSLFIVLKR